MASTKSRGKRTPSVSGGSDGKDRMLRRGTVNSFCGSRVNDSNVSVSTATPTVKPRSSIWTGFRVRPTLPLEKQSDRIKADAVDSTVWIASSTRQNGALNPVGHSADSVFGFSASQADVNTALCMETVPLAFGGGTASVLFVGPSRSGKTCALFASPQEIPDPLAVPVPTPPTSLPHPTPDTKGLSSTHYGGVVPAFLSDVLKRIADLSIYDIKVYVSFLRVTDTLEDLLDPSVSPGLRETVPDKPELVGISEHEVECPVDFTKLWLKAQQNVQSNGATVCTVTVKRTDCRNGAVTKGQIAFIEVPAAEHSKHASLTLTSVTKLLCTIAAMDPSADPGKAFIPWRDSKLTRVMQAVMSEGQAYTPPKVMVMGMLCPSDDMLHESLATASMVSSITRSRKGTVPQEDSKDLARRLQSRLDTLIQVHHSKWLEAQDELVMLRREVHMLKTNEHQPEPHAPTSRSNTPQSKGNLALAKILQVLTKHKVVKPESGSGTAGTIGQLISQIVTREKSLASGGDVSCLQGSKWVDVLQELAAVEPSVVPTVDPRSKRQPFKMQGDTFESWWNEGTVAEVKETTDDAYRREVAWLRSKQGRQKKTPPPPPPPPHARPAVPSPVLSASVAPVSVRSSSIPAPAFTGSSGKVYRPVSPQPPDHPAEELPTDPLHDADSLSSQIDEVLGSAVDAITEAQRRHEEQNISEEHDYAPDSGDESPMQTPSHPKDEDLEWSLSPDNLTSAGDPTPKKVSPHTTAPYSSIVASPPTSLQKLAEGLSPSPSRGLPQQPSQQSFVEPARAPILDVWRETKTQTHIQAQATQPPPLQQYRPAQLPAAPDQVFSRPRFQFSKAQYP